MGAALEEKVTGPCANHDRVRAPWGTLLGKKRHEARESSSEVGADVKSWAEKFRRPRRCAPRAASGAERRVGHWAACTAAAMGIGVRSRQVRGPATPTGSLELSV